MKSVILLVSLFFVSVSSLLAQDMKFGIHGGVDAAAFTFAGAGGGPLKYRSDLAGGLSFQSMFGETAGIQVEANYSAQGTSIISADGAAATSFKLRYITVPVLLQLAATPALHLQVGPQVGFLMSARNYSLNQPDTDVKSELRSVDAYVVLGAEYQFANGVNIGTRYSHGLLDIEESGSDQEIKNHYFSFRLGYKFKL